MCTVGGHCSCIGLSGSTQWCSGYDDVSSVILDWSSVQCAVCVRVRPTTLEPNTGLVKTLVGSLLCMLLSFLSDDFV